MNEPEWTSPVSTRRTIQNVTCCCIWVSPMYDYCCFFSRVPGGVWTEVYKTHRCRIVGSMRRPPRAPLDEHEPCGPGPINMRSGTHRCRIVESMRRPPRAPLNVHGFLRRLNKKREGTTTINTCSSLKHTQLTAFILGRMNPPEVIG